MANKKQSNSKYEQEIERLRNENKWDKLRECVSTPKDSKYELLTKLCLGEADLERYLFFNPLLNDIESSNTYIIEHNLDVVEQCLNDVVGKSDSKLSNEANILLGKLYYSQARYEETLSVLNKTAAPKVTAVTKANLRQTQLYAEAYSLKGLCLEYFQTTRHQKTAVMKQQQQTDDEIIHCFEAASRLAVLHSESIADLYQQHQQQAATTQQQQGGTQQQQQKYSLLMQQADDGFDLMNPLYEIALQKAPILYIKQGKIATGLDKFRSLLGKPHIQSIITIRQCLLKKLGEALLSSVCAANYQPCQFERKVAEKAFRPNNLDEETLLCLSLSQYLASKEVMLLRQPQYKQTREKTFNNAVTSLDLLIVYLTYRRTFPILVEKFESTMKYSFEQFYVWYQYGLSLMSAQKYQKAYLVLSDCNRMRPEHTVVLLLLTQLALEHLLQIDEAITWSTKAIQLNVNCLKARIFYGCALVKKAHLDKQHSNKLKYLHEALESFKKANDLGPHDYLPLYHLANCYALLRKIAESIETVQKALKLKPDDKDCLHLLCLLLTSTKNYEDAYTVICKACALHEDFELIYTRSRIEEHLFGFNECMNSLITLIDVYKRKMRSLDNIHYTLINRSQSSAALTLNNDAASSGMDTASLANLQNTFKLNEAIGKTITMLLQTDTYITKQIQQQQQQQNLSLNYQQAGNKTVENLLQLIRILSEIGEFYLRHDRLADAESCLKEIGSLHAMSYTYMHLKGRILQHKKDYASAKLCYNNALSINPTHLNSLEQLCICLYHLNELNLAEKMCRDAIAINSSLPHLWYILGCILDAASNDAESALRCYQTSIQLESTNPIVQFSSLTKIL